MIKLNSSTKKKKIVFKVKLRIITGERLKKIVLN